MKPSPAGTKITFWPPWSLPGSAIQLHPHVTVVIDEAAASQLEHADYYRYAFANKPTWQGL